MEIFIIFDGHFDDYVGILFIMLYRGSAWQGYIGFIVTNQYPGLERHNTLKKNPASMRDLYTLSNAEPV